MNIFTRILLSFLLCVVSIAAFAQESCSDQLRLAQRRYENGLLEDIPNLLNGCLNKGFTREEKSNAYKLLIQSYIFSNNMAMADEVMLRFLRDFPKYSISPTDHKEFIDLYNTYRTEPIMKIEAKLGMNYSLPWVNEYYRVESLNDNSPSYSSGIGVFGEVNYLNNLFDDFDGSFGFSFSYISLDYVNEPFSFTTVSAKYSKFYVGLPLALRYNINLIGIDFFAKGGFEPSYLLSSSVVFSREIVGAADPIVGTENITAFQKRFDLRPILSAGANFNIGNAQLMITAGFKFGTFFPTDANKRYLNEELYQKYYFISDDFLVHQAYLSLSYIFSIYNPKKIN